MALPICPLWSIAAFSHFPLRSAGWSLQVAREFTGIVRSAFYGKEGGKGMGQMSGFVNPVNLACSSFISAPTQ